MESKSLKSGKARSNEIKKGIALVALATLCTGAGLTLLKIGIQRTTFSFISMLNLPFLAGILFYGLSASLLIMGLKKGNLSTLYPIISLSYVWVIAISFFVFHEPLDLLKTIGSASIILGVAIIGVKGDKKRQEC